MNGLNFLLLLSAIAFCTGCPSGVHGPSQQEIPLAGAVGAGSSAVENTFADEADGRSRQIAAGPRLDSIGLSDGCDCYTCYFAEGTRNRKALEHIREIIYDGGGVPCDVFDPSLSLACADGERALILDSLSSLEWLDSEPWPSMRRLFLAWSEQQLERQWIVYMAERDPAFLRDCSETDSVLVRCADLLGNGGVDREAVRRLKKEIAANEYAETAARDSVACDSLYLETILSAIDRSVDRDDPRELLFMTLSNYINHKIHKRLGKNGNVDFFLYADDFLRVFDSVKVETFEP